MSETKKNSEDIEEVLNRLLSATPEDIEVARKQADKML
jgi:hypothetical protein